MFNNKLLVYYLNLVSCVNTSSVHDAIVAHNPQRSLCTQVWKWEAHAHIHSLIRTSLTCRRPLCILSEIACLHKRTVQECSRHPTHKWWTCMGKVGDFY